MSIGRRLAVLAVLIALGIAALIVWYSNIRPWMLHMSGADNPSGPEYGWWSGFFGDVTIFASVVGGLTLMFRHLNCHVVGCARLGKFPLDGTPYKVCRFHHPDVPNEKRARTVEHMHNMHRAWKTHK